MAERKAAKIYDNYLETEGGCWIWLGSTLKPTGRNIGGYGRVNINKKAHKAHHLFYKRFVGPIPDGMLLRHTCDNPSCVCPDHLVPGTVKQNAEDAVERGRLRRGEDHGNAKLTDDMIRAIRADPRSGMKIGPEYGITDVMVYRIKNRQNWSHVQ